MATDVDRQERAVRAVSGEVGARDQTPREPRVPADALLGIAWYNGLTRQERARWHRIADSAIPADCWEAFKRA